ncbi:hypothetical protein OSTOST_08033 [Ostertagia ostertagi]
MEIALQADPPHIKALQNYLVELTSIIERARSTVSRDSICMAMGILFKYSGALLDVQSGSDAEISCLLHMLAYYHLSSASPNTAEALAWNGMHALEASAAVTRTNLSRSELAALWTRDDLAEYCTDSLIPAEGGIQRLHAGVYRQGLKNYSVKKPAITDEQIEILFKLALLDGILSVSPIGKNMDFAGSSLTSIDVFLWLERIKGKNDLWMTLYATAIHDAIFGAHPHRRRLDELFPDGANEEEDLTVEAVDDIEEHVSRYLATSFLAKGEFGEAERKLLYAKSSASKKLLIRVYESWLKDGHLDDHERDQLSRRVRDLQPYGDADESAPREI